MKLKLQMRKLVQRHGRTAALEVLEEVAQEERVNQMHDVLCCASCFFDPISGHVTYCLKSVYNPYHPSHDYQMGVPCDCRAAWVDVDSM